mgnify:CR=1 FL=1|tara:strand:+ start:61 stop:363 length:303 start_codon:yes stop_codon:yes gene_type:complete
MSELFNSPNAIVVLNDGETYSGMSGSYVYLIDDSIEEDEYDISTFAQDLWGHPGVQMVSIERLVEMYLAFQNMNTHAFNAVYTPDTITGDDETNSFDWEG